MSDYQSELRAALSAAAKASDYLRQAYLHFQAIPDAPVTISTEADKCSQEIILNFLAEHFPADRLCAEENTPALQKSPVDGKRIWVVDPIDGTRGFVMKNGEFSVMIGLIDRGELSVGVVAEPALNRVTYATKGGGCWVTTHGDTPIRCCVSTVAELATATLIQSHAKAGKANPLALAIKPKQIRETYSAGVKLAMVARGEGDLYVNNYSKFADWDICAGHLLVTEAGGIVTELHGNPIRYSQSNYAQKGGLLATNVNIHAAAVLASRSIFLE